MYRECACSFLRMNNCWSVVAVYYQLSSCKLLCCDNRLVLLLWPALLELIQSCNCKSKPIYFTLNVNVIVSLYSTTSTRQRFITICTQKKICGLVTIQFSSDFVKSGVVVKVFTNAYASTVYWIKSKFSWKHNKFAEFREDIQFEHHFSHNVQVLKTKMFNF